MLLVCPFKVRTEHRPRRQLRSIFRRSEKTSFHGRVSAPSTGGVRMSGEGEVGGTEPIRPVVGVGAGNGERVEWTEGVAEGEEGSEW
jgi:hypothetical protein